MKKKFKILIVRSRYNNTIHLYKKAVKSLKNQNVVWNEITVDGAFEIPVTIARYINKFDGFVALGTIIKGQTLNFDLISQAITNGLMELSITYKKPIGNAILTCLNSKQANSRDIRGKEAVDAVLDVLNGKID